MPILTRFPGGGGAAGYKYQIEGAGGITYSRDAEGVLLLKWTDPADMVLDGRALSEWKGTLVVCKEGSAPRSVDDGTVVCDSTVRDRYKETGLPVTIGGPGYYYGVFPYTKDYVVNIDEANTVYVLSEGYDAALENASWSDIAYIADQGRASQIWDVTDEKELTLKGDYNATICVQIAGFDHDDLVGGGKAPISFVIKDIFTNEKAGTNSINWAGCTIRNDILPKIMNSLPEDLRPLIKTVRKKRQQKFYTGWYDVGYVEDDLFLFSLHEVGLSKYLSGNDEGTAYQIFAQDAGNRVRKNLSGAVIDWWTCSARATTSSSPSVSWNRIRSDGSGGEDDTLYGASYSLGIVFGFCI